MRKGITPISIEHCDCVSPAVALLRRGSFPTTPTKASTWAFDLKFLEFARLLSLYGSPNISALSNATVAFLLWSGVENVPVSVSLHCSLYYTCGHSSSVIDVIQVSPHCAPILPASPKCSKQPCLEPLYRPCTPSLGSYADLCLK
jgi:hypothetical protein